MHRLIFRLGLVTTIVGLGTQGCGGDDGGGGGTETSSETDDSTDTTVSTTATTTADTTASTTVTTTASSTADSSGTDPTDTGTTTEGGMRTVSWDITGLEDLGGDYVYEGWLIVGGEPVTAGRFGVVDGTPDVTEFDVAAADADAAEKFVLTIEPVDGDDPAPSATHLIAGDFVDETADLSVADPAALGTDLEDVEGTFILETPSSAAPDDYDQGIWWLDPTGAPDPTFVFPVALPEGWVYEGWVVGDDGPISTGRFASASEADSDAGGPDAGPDPTPPFPGQDFVDPAMSLIGLTAVLSVEPEPDNDPSPFLLKPLVLMDIADMAPPDLQAMSNNAAATNPTGTATLE